MPKYKIEFTNCPYHGEDKTCSLEVHADSARDATFFGDRLARALSYLEEDVHSSRAKKTDDPANEDDDE